MAPLFLFQLAPDSVGIVFEPSNTLQKIFLLVFSLTVFSLSNC
jgi:hypothetical protein